MSAKRAVPDHSPRQEDPMKSLLLSLLLCLAVVAGGSGCVHQLEVINIDSLKVEPTRGRRQAVAVLPFPATGDSAFQPYYEQVLDGLQGDPSVSQVITDWSWEDDEHEVSPAFVVELQPHAEYRGSGWNFLITFPGFLIFTPAWNGFVYHANIVMDIKVYDPSTRKVIASDSIAKDFSLRHCDFGRAFWAETGWWTPYGVLPAL